MLFRDGVFGPIVIHHPQSKEADHDLGPIMLSDWTHRSVEALYKDVAGAVSDSTMDNVLINGQNALADDATKGQRHQLVFEKGKTHRLRLINAAVDTTFRFSIDNHEMEVIAADFVPIVPYKAKTIQLSMGQRYDVLIKAGQDPKDYWLRAFPVAECQGSGHPHADNALAIVRYDAKSTEKPETKDWDTTDDANSCHDELMDNLVPALKKGVPVDEITNTKTIAWEVGVDPDIPFEEGMKFQYNLHIDGADTSETFFADWQYPSKLTVYVEYSQISSTDTNFSQLSTSTSTTTSRTSKSPTPSILPQTSGSRSSSPTAAPRPTRSTSTATTSSSSHRRPTRRSRPRA